MYFPMKNVCFGRKTKDKHFMCSQVMLMVRKREWFKEVLRVQLFCMKGVHGHVFSYYDDNFLLSYKASHIV